MKNITGTKNINRETNLKGYWIPTYNLRTVESDLEYI